MRKEIENWWKQAEHDMEVAAYNLKGGMLDAAAFYCEQSIEKALKAFIMLTQKRSPGAIHSLLKLGKIAEIPEEFYVLLKKLTPEYYLSRYPDVAEDVPYLLYKEQLVKDLIDEAKGVLAWIRTQMKE
jgi:HEPN domain-containing protein